MTIDRAETCKGVRSHRMLLVLPKICIVKLTDKNTTLKILREKSVFRLVQITSTSAVLFISVLGSLG
jgi:hypothetical protein